MNDEHLLTCSQDFNALRKNPEAVKLKREEWILNHDAEAHAYEVYPEIVASLHASN